MPDIYGFAYLISPRKDASVICSGAFTCEVVLDKVQTDSGGSYWSEDYIYFNASDWDVTYGASSYVRPNSIEVIFIIKF